MSVYLPLNFFQNQDNPLSDPTLIFVSVLYIETATPSCLPSLSAISGSAGLAIAHSQVTVIIA